MAELRLWSVERAAGFALVLASVILLPGLMMFWFRGGERGGLPPSPAYFTWERGFILAAIVLTAIGFMLLEGLLQDTGGRVPARVGAIAYLIAAVLGVLVEAFNLSQAYRQIYPLVVIYVVLAYLAQATIGVALLRAALVAGWIGWATIAWSLIWLVVLPITTPRDIYFPVLHHVAPLVIGIALLMRR
jgi:hypothetical protein